MVGKAVSWMMGLRWDYRRRKCCVCETLAVPS